MTIPNEKGYRHIVFSLDFHECNLFLVQEMESFQQVVACLFFPRIHTSHS